MNASGFRKLLAYIVMPVVFCAVGYLVLWLALLPVWGMASAAISFLVADEAPQFSSEVSSYYDPNSYKQSDAQSDPGAPAGSIDGKEVRFPFSGEQYGQITCDTIGLDAPVYWYDSDEILLYGAGQSLISSLPGFGEAIILCGHNTTFFACFQDIAPGNVIDFKTNYCDYQYTVTNVQVYHEDDLSKLLLDKSRQQKEELIMYTCYPFEMITGRKTERLVVFADRTAGRDVAWKEIS